ncbi:hypothetical protein CRI64_22990 [Escherichia sp. E2748]|nr:hypothetical protein CRI64_22990 [Escherichia sp. E2748]
MRSLFAMFYGLRKALCLNSQFFQNIAKAHTMYGENKNGQPLPPVFRILLKIR